MSHDYLQMPASAYYHNRSSLGWMIFILKMMMVARCFETVVGGEVGMLVKCQLFLVVTKWVKACLKIIRERKEGLALQSDLGVRMQKTDSNEKVCGFCPRRRLLSYSVHHPERNRPLSGLFSLLPAYSPADSDPLSICLLGGRYGKWEQGFRQELIFNNQIQFNPIKGVWHLF